MPKTPQFNPSTHNHALQSQKVADIADEILNTYGNKPFDWRDAHYKVHHIDELVANGFLRHGSDGEVMHSGKVVIGKAMRTKRAS